LSDRGSPSQDLPTLTDKLSSLLTKNSVQVLAKLLQALAKQQQMKAQTDEELHAWIKSYLAITIFQELVLVKDHTLHRFTIADIYLNE